MEFHQLCELHRCVYFLYRLKKILKFHLTPNAKQNIESRIVFVKYVSLKAFE